MKKVSLILFLVVLVTVVLVKFFYRNNQSAYNDLITMKISPSKEECDDYNVLWKVDSISNSSYSFVKDELVYILNSKLVYNDSLNEQYLVDGVLLKEKRKEHYLECGSPWIFSDSLITTVIEVSD